MCTAQYLGRGRTIRRSQAHQQAHRYRQQRATQCSADRQPQQAQVALHHAQAQSYDGLHQRGDEHGPDDHGRAVEQQAQRSDGRRQATHDEKVHAGPRPVPHVPVHLGLPGDGEGGQRVE